MSILEEAGIGDEEARDWMRGQKWMVGDVTQRLVSAISRELEAKRPIQVGDQASPKHDLEVVWAVLCIDYGQAWCTDALGKHYTYNVADLVRVS